jgi:DNA-binding NtrC family response regulator
LLNAWESDAWPGNVRGLRNAVARRIALGHLTVLQSSSPSVPPAASSPSDSLGFLEQLVAARLPFPEARRRVIEELEVRYVEKVLAEHGGNVTRAAAASGIARRQLQRVKGRASR